MYKIFHQTLRSLYTLLSVPFTIKPNFLSDIGQKRSYDLSENHLKIRREQPFWQRRNRVIIKISSENRQRPLKKSITLANTHNICAFENFFALRYKSFITINSHNRRSLTWVWGVPAASMEVWHCEFNLSKLDKIWWQADKRG